MSLADCSKTIRKLPEHIPQNPLIQIDFQTRNEEYIKLFDFGYSPHVSYSTKKRNRWMLSAMLCDGEYDHEDPFIYTKQQCIWDKNPIKTNYLFDSLTNKSVGSIDISDQKVHGKGFNGSSVINALENEFDYSNREIKQFNNLRNRGKEKRKKSRKHHRVISTYIPAEYEALPPKDEHLQNIEKRKNCVHIKEFIHVNNLSRVNMTTSLGKNNAKNSSGKMKESTNRKRLISDDFSENGYLDWDDTNECMEDFVEEIDNELDSQSVKSFELTMKVFSNKTKLNKKQRRSHKKVAKQPSQPLFNPKGRIHHVSIQEEDTNKLAINLIREVLPHITVDMSSSDLIDDLNVISGICRCWVSDTKPRFILADLENIVETKNKSFIIFKPTTSKDPEIISVKIFFNSVDSDFSEILDGKFVNLREMVQCLQTSLQSTVRTKSPSSQHFLELKSSNEDSNKVWQTMKRENQSNLYLEHQEWKMYEMDQTRIGEIVREVSESQAFAMENCEICLMDTRCDETITINSCKHKVCETCLSSHLIYRVEMGMETLNCPGSGCSVELDCAMTLSMMSWKQYQKRSNNLKNSVIRKTGTTCYNCGAVLIWKGKESAEVIEIFEYICRCNERVCILCGKRQHWPSSCLEMRKHNQKLRELKDLEKFSEKVTPFIVKGIQCPKCAYFVEKDGGCNHLTCICGAHFCWICGDLNDKGRHVLSGFPCQKNSYAKRLKFDLSDELPELSEIRPRLYVLSLEQRTSSLRSNTKKLFSNINEIFIQKLDIDYGKYNAQVVENQFIQLLSITECSLVKAYQLDKRKKLKLYNYLRSTVSVLIFYQDEIKRCIEAAHYSINHHHRRSSSIIQIKSDYSKLCRILSNAEAFINQMYFILRV